MVCKYEVMSQNFGYKDQPLIKFTNKCASWGGWGADLGHFTGTGIVMKVSWMGSECN